MVEPKPKDVVCDPACGTCGFLVAVGEYLRARHPELFADKQLLRHFHGTEAVATSATVSTGEAVSTVPGRERVGALKKTTRPLSQTVLTIPMTYAKSRVPQDVSTVPAMPGRVSNGTPGMPGAGPFAGAAGLFHGFDFDNTMLCIGSMNMLLHGVENPEITYRDSLAQDNAGETDKYTLVLANPPFAGSLYYESLHLRL